MPNRYTQLPLTKAIEGMTLSDDVLDTKGNVLLPGGTVLTAALLASLERHGIDMVAIAGPGLSPADSQADLERHIARLARLFRVPGSVTNNAPGSTGALPEAQALVAATDVLHQYVLNFRLGQTS